MSAQLLNECMNQFDFLGFEIQFHSYFKRIKSQLLESGEVACGLVALTVQEGDEAERASQILGLLLDEARMGLENDSEYAQDFLETVEMAVHAGIAAGAIEQKHQMEFAGLYRKVGLPVPQLLIIDPNNMLPPPGIENFDISENLENLARDVTEEGGSAYDLFNAIDTMLAAVPEEVQASLANHIATMDGPFFERCALFTLLSGSALVQEATIAGLFERLDSTALCAETQALLPMIRGWFSRGLPQEALDMLIKNARRKAMPVRGITRRSKIESIMASVTDGVGAQNITIMLPQGQKTVIAMILLKVEHGVKDAFLIPPESSDDAENMIAQLRVETGANDISYNTLRVLLEGALADGLENGCLPAPGFLDVVEACNLFDLRPQKLDLQALLDLADPVRKIQDASTQALGRWINDDDALNSLDPLTDSWFEDTEDTRKIVATTRNIRSIETKMWKFLDTRRDIWTRRFLQTAVMLQDGDQHRECRILTASAYGLMNGRPLRHIALMEYIIYTTLTAAGVNTL